MKEEQSLNLLESISEKGTEITADMLEVAVDELLDNSILKDIPIFGTLFKAYSISKKITEAYYIKKVIKFLYELQSVSHAKKQKFINQLESENEQRKAGENILLILNKLDDVDKASIIGKLFKAVLNEYISFSDYKRLAQIVDKTFYDDLLLFKDKRSFNESSETVKESLYQSGLLLRKHKDNSAFEEHIRKSVDYPNFKAPVTYKYELNDYSIILNEYGF